MRCDVGPRGRARQGHRLLYAFGIAGVLSIAANGAWAQEDAHAITQSTAAAAPRYLHAEKLSAGAVLNDSLEIERGIDANRLSQVGNHVYYDGDKNGLPEIIVARAYLDGQGRIVAGAPPEGLVPDYDLRYGPGDKEQIVASLKVLAGLHAKGQLGRPGFLQRQAQILAGLRPESLGVEDGLFFLSDLWEAGLIDAVLYGVKRHEMLDAIVTAAQ